MKQLVIIGASGHGKVVADIAEKCGYKNIFFLDDNDTKDSCNGYCIVGKTREFVDFDCDFFVAIGNSKIRKKIQCQLKNADKSIVTLIHPNAIISEDVKIGIGTVVMAGAVINPSTKIGEGCIINTCASIDHDNSIGDYVHISVGAHTAGNVNIGNNTWLGIGAIISNNLSICEDSTIGAGAVVVKNIIDKGIYKGVPAMKSEITKKSGGGRA